MSGANPSPLSEDATRFRALVDLSPDILSIVDSEGHLVFNSAAAWQTHGYRAEDLQGRDTFKLIHPDDRAAVEAEFATLLAHPEQWVRVRYRYRNADDSYTWMEAAGRNELANPALRGVITISRDISAQIAAEQALRDSEQRFRMLFAANPQPIIIFDLETLRCVEVNATALQLYGYSRDEFLRLIADDALSPSERPHAAQAFELLRAGRISGKVDHIWKHLTKDGREIDVEVTAQRIEWKGRLSCIALIHDVTEQVKLQHKLEQTQKLDSLGLLAGGVAHDFNNLLTAIIGHASLVAEDLPEGSAAHGSMHLLQETAHRAADLCRQMLAYSGRGRFAVRTIELSGFVRDTAELLKSTVPKNIALQLDLAADLPPIEGDTAQLQQVAMNLVVNAADALGDAGGAIRLATRLVHADRALFETMYLAPQLTEGDYVVLQVSDTGCGMSPETAAKVFDPFFSTKFTGRGLGLAAVLGIVRGHHGAIKVESTPGKGSTFTLLFPASVKAPAAHPAAADAASPRPSRATTVLVVDDEDCVRRTVQAMLRRNDIQVLLAEDGQAGLELYAARHGEIDAVLLDLTMPKLDGIEALGQMLAIDPAARILLMSGFDENTETARYGNLGQKGFVQKPFTIQSLLDKIRRALG